MRAGFSALRARIPHAFDLLRSLLSARMGDRGHGPCPIAGLGAGFLLVGGIALLVVITRPVWRMLGF